MFTTIDWLIIFAYLLFAFLIGALMTRKAGRGLASYFVADRSLPWWWLGTSMVATTFAADTPLAVTGIIAKDGISGNWFWWSWIFGFITITVFFARRWSRSGVLTDVELIELRYGGRPATILRGFKAFYMGIIINCIILGWVFRAMSKITTPFVDWQTLLGGSTYSRLLSAWPSFLIFDNFNNTLTVLIIFVIVVAYSSMGGIRGVILTDLFQFTLAMAAAILFAVFAVEYVGGMEKLLISLHTLYPRKADEFIRFMPRFDNRLLPFQVFLIFVGMQWWARYNSDGSGYLAQRMNTARTPGDAEKGALWFTLANFCLRTWPWVVVGLVALVVFPLHDPTQFHALGEHVAADREMAYPVLMKLILPSGWLGLTFVSLMAAFMSTVDTHINWGASYLVNDVYQRFVRPRATQRELVWVSRLGVVLISLVAILVATQVQSIESAWKFLVAMGAGLGLPQLLRWWWWRANAWTEIGGMLIAFFSSVILYSLFPQVRSEYLMFWIILISSAGAVLITLLTPPVEDAVLQNFIRRTDPIGFWRGMGAGGDRRKALKSRLGFWLLGVLTTFWGMFGIGYVILLQWMKGVGLLVASGVAFVVMVRLMSRGDER
ncbi:MAG: sodium transporter [Calditrichaeota bacterium]|nr:MAG: sodium transporter [Calditrichota bacterium]